MRADAGNEVVCVSLYILAVVTFGSQFWASSLGCPKGWDRRRGVARRVGVQRRFTNLVMITHAFRSQLTFGIKVLNMTISVEVDAACLVARQNDRWAFQPQKRKSDPAQPWRMQLRIFKNLLIFKIIKESTRATTTRLFVPATVHKMPRHTRFTNAGPF